MKYKVIDLFCGCGGLSHGFSSLGCEVIGADVNEWVPEIFKKNGIGTAEVMDLCRNNFLKPCDILIGGPPCRAWSKTNHKKRGIYHDKYQLLGTFFYHVSLIGPLIFVMENVPDARRDIEKYLKPLSERYAILSMVVNYWDYGAALKKYRLIVIGTRRDLCFKPYDIVSLIKKSGGKNVRDAIQKDFTGDSQHVWPEKLNISERIEELCLKNKYGYTILKWNRPAPAFVNIMRTYVLHPDYFRGQSRVISIREALCLTGFPDTYQFPEGMGMFLRYQMVADAVSPAFSKALAKALLKTLDNLNGEKKRSSLI